MSLVEVTPRPNTAQRVTAGNCGTLAACLLGGRELKERMPSSDCGHRAGRKALRPAHFGERCLARAVVILPAHRRITLAGSWTFDHSLGRGTEAQVPPLSRKNRETPEPPPWTGIGPPTLPSPALPQKLHQIGDFLMIRPQGLLTI